MYRLADFLNGFFCSVSRISGISVGFFFGPPFWGGFWDLPQESTTPSNESLRTDQAVFVFKLSALFGGKMNPFLSPYFEKWGSCGTKKFLMASWFLNKYSSRRWKKQHTGIPTPTGFSRCSWFFCCSSRRATFKKKTHTGMMVAAGQLPMTKLHPTFESFLTWLHHPIFFHKFCWWWNISRIKRYAWDQKKPFW